MKKTFYEKRGRRYYPVCEYDHDLMASFPTGNHLITVLPGVTSRRYNVDPDYALMIAAGQVAEEAILRAMIKASELRPSRPPVTKKQQIAWQNLISAFGDDMYPLHSVSLRDIVAAGIEAMQVEAVKLLKNTSVKKAYERFQMVAELARETNGRR